MSRRGQRRIEGTGVFGLDWRAASAKPRYQALETAEKVPSGRRFSSLALFSSNWRSCSVRLLLS